MFRACPAGHALFFEDTKGRVAIHFATRPLRDFIMGFPDTWPLHLPSWWTR